jgi:hypothetical protein
MMGLLSEFCGSIGVLSLLCQPSSGTLEELRGFALESLCADVVIVYVLLPGIFLTTLVPCAPI